MEKGVIRTAPIVCFLVRVRIHCAIIVDLEMEEPSYKKPVAHAKIIITACVQTVKRVLKRCSRNVGATTIAYGVHYERPN